MAVQAWQEVRPPFSLATCGWVLGPPSDRTLFDQVLPKDVAMSSINREVGKAPVDPGFSRISGRSLWAIPWMEDDPALTSPQLWAGRMRRDAADALRYGCDGLLGIHWRTRVLSANVLALARAAWDQSWNTLPEERRRGRRADHRPVRELRRTRPIAGRRGRGGGLPRRPRPRLRLSSAGPERHLRRHPPVRRRVEIDRTRGRVFDVLLQGRRVAREPRHLRPGRDSSGPST